jgi:hypothetical protein
VAFVVFEEFRNRVFLGGKQNKFSWIPGMSHLATNTQGPGVDVMMTFFCDFPPFSAKKWAFSKTNNIINFFA